MQYTKPMIDQVFQIRKVAPDHIRAQIKLANPNLLDYMAEIYWQFHDKSLRELIQQLMSMAGPPWLTLLEENPQTRPNHSQQVYRGRVRPEALQFQAPPVKTPTSAKALTHTQKEKIVIYRGQVVQFDR